MRAEEPKLFHLSEVSASDELIMKCAIYKLNSCILLSSYIHTKIYR